MVMDDLMTWLRATLDEIERVARDAAEQDWRRALSYAGDLAEHVDMHNPARVLAEVEAKRRILDEHAPESSGLCRTCAVEVNDGYDLAYVEWPCLTVRLLVLPLADQPGYQEEWRPSPT